MLIDGGFDDLDSLYLATADTLRLLGFSNPDDLHKQIRDIIGYRDDQEANKEGVILDQDPAQLVDLNRQMEEMKLQHSSKQDGSSHQEDAQSEVKLEGKSTSIQMIVGPKEAKKGKLHIEAFIQKMTHLHLEHKGVELIENLQDCKMLSHVYLQENMIYTLVNDPFKGLHNIV
jgi:hypothetical protein